MITIEYFKKFFEKNEGRKLNKSNSGYSTSLNASHKL